VGPFMLTWLLPPLYVIMLLEVSSHDILEQVCDVTCSDAGQAQICADSR